MEKKLNTLGLLRQEIDEIDNEIHDLLMQRCRVVERIGAVKKNAGNVLTSMRPAREATIIRRLIGRHSGLLPVTVIGSVWRELISAFTSLQGPLSVSVCAPQMSVGYWDIARCHFGSNTTIKLHRSPIIVLREVAQGLATVGVLPLPRFNDSDPWWSRLVSEGNDSLKIISRLPFLVNEGPGLDELSALVVAQMPQESSSDDKSLLIIGTEKSLSGARVNEFLVLAGFRGSIISASDARAGCSDSLHLLEVDGFVDDKDLRLQKLFSVSDGCISKISKIGGYAVQMKVISHA